jgi:hypothetical protein
MDFFFVIVCFLLDRFSPCHCYFSTILTSIEQLVTSLFQTQILHCGGLHLGHQLKYFSSFYRVDWSATPTDFLSAAMYSLADHLSSFLSPPFVSSQKRFAALMAAKDVARKVFGDADIKRNPKQD